MSKSRKVLIIKTGFSEFLDRGISTTISLGDVLICTSILHVYKNDEVTWVTDWQAKDLLVDNPYIKHLLIFGTQAFETISRQQFDIIINLEKDIGISTFLNKIKAKIKYGFYFNDRKHGIQTHNASTQFLLSGQENHKDIHKNALELLYETIGHKWEGQGLLLNYKKNAKVKYDIGFNHAVGNKWPTKAWPMEHWKMLEKTLKSDYSIIWQEGFKNLKKYIQWISHCRLIVTSDSLGQAIGQALGKKVLTLYGPTNYLRMKGVPNVQVVASTLKCPVMPCFLPVCTNKEFCMDYIDPQTIANQCKELLK